ncbi:MAG: glycosyltransferase family 9 protein [Gammaproteobacteria bacterium]|nr:glycosyltransferase family 9 protein [Gammaproteobacteria bacterium]
MAQADTNKILLITLSNIGDALMTTPVLEALHHRYPQAVIDIVTDARASDLFEYCPYRGEIILKQKGWRGTIALLKRLRVTRYDLIVDLRTDGLTLLLRARRKLTRRGNRTTGGHAVERHFGVITQNVRPAKIPPQRIWLTKYQRTFAQQRLADLPGKRWLALGPGARWAPKCWSPENYVDLANQLTDYFDAIILLGSNDDMAACQRISESLALPHRNLAGKTDLLQAAAILEQAQLFVGSDSGLGHLAAASGTATLTVFGPGDPERYHPWQPQARWVQSGNDSIDNVTVRQVVEHVRVAT